jgi:hypothetical protein
MPDRRTRLRCPGTEVPESGGFHCVGDSADVEGGRRACDFADAEEVIEGSLGDEGTDAWTSVGFTQRRDAEVQVLKDWADSSGLEIPPEATASIEPGRMEHDLIYIGTPPRQVLKVTKGHRFGFRPWCDPNLVSGMVSDWFVLKPATPLQYLRRMVLTHELFPALEHRLGGFAMLTGQFRIVISQRLIDPVAASPGAIADYFTAAGFARLLMESWYREADNIAIFDAGGTNVLEFEGHLFPIDILPVRPGPVMLDRIREALQVPFWSR